MFADPQTVTINAVAKVMPKLTSTGLKSEYALADGTFKLTVSHLESRDRIRSMTRVDQRLVVPDPLTAVNDFETLSTYYVIDRPLFGFSSAQVEQQSAGLFVWLSPANIAKLYGRES